MVSCYLTIDDSPSHHTDDMVDFLDKRQIQALFFIRGDLAKNNPEPIIRAIDKGHIIGNHSYAHRPFGDMPIDEAIADIEKCEGVINDCYQKADKQRHGKYFRFPYLDRGNGDRIERHFDKITDINVNANNDVKAIQDYLSDNGFTQPFTTNHPIYNNPSIANAADCLMIFTSYDWMMSDRHRGQWDYKTINDLKTRIDDSDIKDHSGNILIFHDQDDTFETFKSLIDHMLLKGYEFLSYDNTEKEK